jgi:cell division septation protein DedD
VKTKPQTAEPAKQEPTKQEPAKPERAKQEPVRTEPAPKKLPPASDLGEQPAHGTYLQLAATSKREADIFVDVLRKKGFKSLAAEHPDKPGVFRVLVGPMPDSAVNKTRADLTAASFPGDKAVRKTY